jgi:putative transposase
MIEPQLPDLSVRRQCELIGLSRSSFYYSPATETEHNLLLMRLIDEQYTKTPFYGWPRLTLHLRRLGHEVNHKRVRRLMRRMNLQAISPGPKTTVANREHKKYPYLLRDFSISRVNQVWSADMTYVPMRAGFMYLMAIIDWFSRYVITWQLSNTLDGEFCLQALEGAKVWTARDIQHRPGGSVHGPGFHLNLGGCWHPCKPGWARSGIGQYLC